ncbi:unnamed protein product [Caenorhabditis sp. 36 PRJEB53466]|nr:unnamed protein product [Caenorhabditis sp. 36 PRJEB53466]
MSGLKLKQKRSKIEAFEEEEEVDEIPVKQYFSDPKNVPGTSTKTSENEPADNALAQLEYELQQPQLNVHEIGRIITEGMMEKQLSDESLGELARKLAKSIQGIPNIDVWNLADELSKGVLDSRLVVIGNAFLWNLLKTSVSAVRDKFEQYHHKVSRISSNATTSTKVDFVSSRVQPGEHLVPEGRFFRKTDLLDVFHQVVFRKTGDVFNKSKQFIRAYLVRATTPRCAVWHFSLRQSGTSHKKILQDIPHHVLDTLLHFLLSLCGLGDRELALNFEELNVRTRFFGTLGENDEARQTEFEHLKTTRENMIARFRTCVTDVLNEIREMPYNYASQELLPPPRGKRVDHQQCVTWRQYETLVKKCESNPSKENLEAKQELDYQLRFTYEMDIEIEDGIDK